MNYATWKLNFSNPDYGTGPEDKVAQLGFSAEGAWANDSVENGATILGYVSEELNETKLDAWQFQNISQEEALDFCKLLNPKAYLLSDGRITTPIEEVE